MEFYRVIIIISLVILALLTAFITVYVREVIRPSSIAFENELRREHYKFNMSIADLRKFTRKLHY